MKRALVFGASGQAGRYLCDLLVARDYKVFGTYYRHMPEVMDRRLNGLHVNWKTCDVKKREEIRYILQQVKPDEVYNMASMMFAPASWEYPSDYALVNYMATVHMLDLINALYPKCKFFQGGSAEVFDRSKVPQDELTPLRPGNPYGVAKVAAQELVRVYREHKGLFACTGIFFNMESPLRAPSFFSRKVITEVVRISRELQKGTKLVTPMKLGKLHAIRDWGYTKEYMEAAHLMMQAHTPDDYVIATGLSYTCKDFIRYAFNEIGLDWSTAQGLIEYERSDPSELGNDTLNGYPRKIDILLGWKSKIHLPDLIKLMVEAEIQKTPDPMEIYRG